MMGKDISIQFLNLARAFLMSGWYVLIFFLIRQKKVTLIHKLQVTFYIIIGIYLLLIVGEIFISIDLIDTILDFKPI